MGQVLHGCATTTEAVRRAIQNSQESLRALAKRYGINQKTVAKWKERETVADIPTGPRDAKSTVLSIEEEAIIVAFRRHTLLPLDDCLYALQPTIPHLTRSSLHRCLQRHGISRLPEVEGSKPPKKKFKAYPIGYFHIDIAELQTAEGKLYLYVAIDRTSKFAFVQLVRKTGRTSASAFLEALIAAVPYKIHTVLTDNGIQFTFPPRYADGPTARYVTHMFDMRCQENGIEHRLTKIKHPWTNGQVERMNRTIKEATVQRYHYDRHDQLEAHLADFINAYNYARRLKTLKGLTPYEYICKCWTSQPERFKLNPLQQMPGLNTCSSQGCFAMTDEAISEVYAIAREAFSSGQRSFQFQSYPFRTTATNLAKHRGDDHLAFWNNLKEGSDIFEVSGQQPAWRVANRRYAFDSDPAFAGEIAAKSARDQREFAAHVKNGVPAIRLVYEDGGGHPSLKKLALAAAKNPGSADVDERTRRSLGDISRPDALASEPREIPIEGNLAPSVRGHTKDPRSLTQSRSKAKRSTPEDRNEAAEGIRALVEKITLHPGPNRGEIDATLQGELGTILGWIEAQAVEKTRKRETPAAFATGASVSVVAGTRNHRYRHSLIVAV